MALLEDGRATLSQIVELRADAACEQTDQGADDQESADSDEEANGPEAPPEREITSRANRSRIDRGSRSTRRTR